MGIYGKSGCFEHRRATAIQHGILPPFLPMLLSSRSSGHAPSEDLRYLDLHTGIGSPRRSDTGLSKRIIQAKIKAFRCAALL